LALVNLGISPFLYWSNHLPGQMFFAVAVIILAYSGVLFLFNLNLVIARLGAMLPDETLRQETRQFTAVNRGLLAVLLLAASIYFCLMQLPNPPVALHVVAMWLDRGYVWATIVFLLLPLMVFVLLPVA